MVSGDRKSSQRLLDFQTLESSCGGVIRLWPTVEAALKSPGIFPDVMGQAGQLSLFLRIKGRRIGRAQRGGSFQMIADSLLSPIFCDVCQIFICAHAETTPSFGRNINCTIFRSQYTTLLAKSQ